MGPKKSRLLGTSALGTATECPICAEIFGKKVTYDVVSICPAMLLNLNTSRLISDK